MVDEEKKFNFFLTWERALRMPKKWLSIISIGEIQEVGGPMASAEGKAGNGR